MLARMCTDPCRAGDQLVSVIEGWQHILRMMCGVYGEVL
jgi:hypothetical protein